MNPQAIALAGVFQATELVRQAAHHGTWSGFAATASLDSLFRLESDSVEAVYGDLERLRLGVESLIGVLGGEDSNPECLQYAVGLLQLQKSFLRNMPMMETVGGELERIQRETADLDDPDREERRAEQVAELYTRTISTLTPRIVVNGRPQHLQTPRTVAWIRTLLFAGLRSAVLWKQLGGGRFSLLIGRRKLLGEARELLEG